jgi:hypothetical protein
VLDSGIERARVVREQDAPTCDGAETPIRVIPVTNLLWLVVRLWVRGGPEVIVAWVREWQKVDSDR